MPAAFWSPMPTTVLALAAEADASAAQAIRHVTATMRARLRDKTVSCERVRVQRPLRGTRTNTGPGAEVRRFTLTICARALRHLDPGHGLDQEPEQGAR